MNIVVDKNMTAFWKWNDESLTIFFRPSVIERGEHYIRNYIMHEVIEANLARVICGGKCNGPCEKLLDEKWIVMGNPFKIKTRGPAGICHVLAWLIGRW